MEAAYRVSMQVLSGLAAALGTARGQNSERWAVAMAQAVPECKGVVLAASTVIAQVTSRKAMSGVAWQDIRECESRSASDASGANYNIAEHCKASMDGGSTSASLVAMLKST